jgi:3-keto-disaccharide hydrolase
MRGFLMLVVLIVTLAACNPPPAPTANLPYETGFDSAGQWMQTANRQADIFVQDSQLHIVVKQPDTLAWSVAGLALADFTLDVDATPLDGPDDNGYGIIARRIDDENLYSFQVSGDGYFIIQKRVKGKWTNLTGDWQSAPAIHPGKQANHLHVTCKGNVLTFTANDTQLAQVTDGDLARGDIGVVASTFSEPDVHVAFDNVSVKQAE